MDIEVTLGVCVRNCQDTVLDVLKSISNQDFPREQTEIILVDDGSTDSTLQILKTFASCSDIKTRVYSQYWKGVASARNVVVRESRGKYVVWVDGDMEIPRDFVSKLVEYMNNHPEVGAAKGNYDFLDTKKIPALLENIRVFDLRPNSPKLWGTGGAIYRVDLLKEIGGFDERNRGAGEDIDVLIRILKKGWHVHVVSVKFRERFKDTWKSLWKQYYWWGYGARYVYKKHGGGISILPHLPPIAFLIGFIKLLLILRHKTKLEYLLLPIHNLFKETAWCCGFFIG